MATREATKARTREALLDAALKVTAKRGFSGSRLDEIASTAGVTTGAIYGQFSGKDELFLALVDREITRLSQHILVAVVGNTDTVMSTRRVAQVLLEIVETEPGFYALLMDLWARALRDPEFRAVYLGRRQMVTAVLAQALQLGLGEDRELVMPPEQLAILVEAVGDGLAIRRLVDPEAMSHELALEFAERLSEAFTRPRR